MVARVLAAMAARTASAEDQLRSAAGLARALPAVFAGRHARRFAQNADALPPLAAGDA